MVKKKLHICFYTFEYKQSQAFAWPHCVFFQFFYLLLCFIVPFITSFIASFLLCFNIPLFHCSLALLFLRYILLVLLFVLLFPCCTFAFNYDVLWKRLSICFVLCMIVILGTFFYLPLLFHYFALGCFSHLHWYFIDAHLVNGCWSLI